MSDDDQNTTQGVDQTEEQAANQALEQSANSSLSDIEYATPSAFIDPDLPAYKKEEVKEEIKEEEKPEEETLEMTPEQIEEMMKASRAVMAKVAEKIANSRNILIATSSDPSVDELSSAITLTRFLDRLGKHAIAIYSGEAPKALAFLNPAEYFENSADVLQDFVISLSKEKADHLRYKVEDESVKVFITPYKDRIVSDDLEFSYGDYNVDLVLALNVNNGVDLDPALREYGTIMHDATVVNITTGNPGKFGEIEWNNKRASSVSEMIADLLCNASGDVKLEPEEATALLTGIVASTDRFAHANTFSTTMQIASQLIEFGASPEIVAENITDDVDNQFFAFSDLKPKKEEDDGSDNISFSFKPTEPAKSKVDPDDTTALEIAHDGEEQPEEAKEEKEEPKEEEKPEEEKPEESEKEEEKSEEPAKPEDSSLLDELKATEASLSNASAMTTPVEEPAPAPVSNIAPTIEAPASINDFPTNKYSQMLEDALSEPATAEAAPMESGLPPMTNPAASAVPEVTAAPEVSGMPEINYGQNNDQILPPPPMPPVDTQSMPLPTMPIAPEIPNEPVTAPAPVEPQTPAAGAPDTFAIPGV